MWSQLAGEATPSPLRTRFRPGAGAASAKALDLASDPKGGAMRRLLMLVPVAIGTVTLAGAALVPAGAGLRNGSAPLTIEKEVDGVVPPDTEFTVKVECDNANIFTPNGPVASATVDFDEKGHPDGSDTITFTNEGICTVTETHDGDAEDVSYECEGQFPEANAPSEGVRGRATGRSCRSVRRGAWPAGEPDHRLHRVRHSDRHGDGHQRVPRP